MDARALLLGPDAPPAPPPLSAVPLAFNQAAAVQRAFGLASERLLTWPQDIGGQWIERTELARLTSSLLSVDGPPLIALLGDPGVGKSALLARLGADLAAGGGTLLALKADQLPRGIATPADLDMAINGPVPVAEALRRLAADRPTYLLIDQLDALADLMDQHSGRLAALLRLTAEVRGTPGLRIILSCRAFEYKHDPRLSALAAESVMLEPPPWEAVQALLTARGVSTDGWTEEAKSVLRIPQHLSLFLRHGLGTRAPAFTTYHAMLDAMLDDLARRLGARVVEAAEHIAISMAAEEELSLARARFTRAYATELDLLEREGLLLARGSAITFKHQTLFDFLRARAFLREGTSVADFVITQKQESLFVRSTLWSALTFLRDADRSTYRREFWRLWTHDGLRAHLHDLLAQFLAQVSDPEDEEAYWLLPLLDDPHRRRRTLNAMAGRPGWFARVKHRLPTLMRLPPAEAWETTWFLIRALPFAHGDVVALVKDQWSRDGAYGGLCARVLCELTTWGEASVDLACHLAETDSVTNWDVAQMSARIATSIPDHAPRIIAVRLDRLLNQALLQAPPEPEPPQEPYSDEDGWSYAMARLGRFRSVERLIDGNNDWYDIGKLARGAPGSFLRALWPWVLRVLDVLAEPPHPFLRRYRTARGLAFSEGPLEQPLPAALEEAVKGFAHEDPDGFLEFTSAAQEHDNEVIHQLLAAGMEAFAEKRPTDVLSYLLADPRRLIVGDSREDHKYSKRIISALAPALQPAEIVQLEHAIRTWEQYIRPIPDEDLKSRRQRGIWTREHRLRLLRAIPEALMSPAGRRHRMEEERALPGTAEMERRGVESYWVGAVVSAEQMPQLSDDAILRLFGILTDDTEHNPKRPHGPTAGGSVEASRAFEAVAKAQPERAMRLIERFQPGSQERPTGVAVRALAGNKDVPADTIIALVHRLDGRGFASAAFRHDAAYALASAAARNAGLPDETLDLLEGWLKPGLSKAAVAGGKPRDEDTLCLLWGGGGWFALPDGNYPPLQAIAEGLLHRQPMDADGWLARLESHLRRRDSDETWIALCGELRYLQHADPVRVRSFLLDLLDIYPTVAHSERGIRAIAHLLEQLSPDQVDGILTDLISGNWLPGPIAAGELAALALCHAPANGACRTRVDGFLTAAGLPLEIAARLRLGLANTMKEAWEEPSLRPMATDLLLQLFPMADEKIASVLHGLIDQSTPLIADRYTTAILKAMVGHPSILAGSRGTFVGERLKDLLACGGIDLDDLHALCLVLADLLERQNDVGQGTTPIDPGDLLDIALTLHRLPETRSWGLTLFERLLSMNLTEANDRMKALDRRPFHN